MTEDENGETTTTTDTETTPDREDQLKAAMARALDKEELAEKLHKCKAELEEVLERHGFMIAPYWESPEPVGRFGNKIMLTASFGLVPRQ